MFDINNEKKIEKEAEFKAKQILAKMMTEAILTSDTAPEDIKLKTKIMMQVADLTDLFGKKVIGKYCGNNNNANIETLKKVAEYLELVEIGIKQFLECTPLVVDNEGDNENGN